VNEACTSVLTWQHRIAASAERCHYLFGREGWRWRLIRASNSGAFTAGLRPSQHDPPNWPAGGSFGGRQQLRLRRPPAAVLVAHPRKDVAQKPITPLHGSGRQYCTSHQLDFRSKCQ
jgi:hypothetical protein